MSKPVSAISERPSAATPKATLTPAQVEAEYGFLVDTLKDWRYKGIGPKFFKTSPGKGGSVRYRRTEIEAWIDERTVECESPAAA